LAKKVLVTGGAGYIGSHTILSLLEAGIEVVALDNLCNSSIESIFRVEMLSGKSVTFVEGDIRDTAVLETLFNEHNISAVLHFAGLKSVGESAKSPISYYENNVVGSLNLFRAMARARVFELVFSSSATVYGDPSHIPISENLPVGVPTNPYGRSKLIIEEILRDISQADPQWNIAILRYFNPVGAHYSGMIGEDPNGIPNNLLPYISQVAIGRLSKLSVFGNDYPTRDGTGVRDYIHVVDLANGHLKALQAISIRSGIHVWNLGTGNGHSVLEMIRAFEKISGKTIPFNIAPRRKGDIAECWADSSKANEELDWRAERDLEVMIKDTWHWQSVNPKGYN
jgi:UDP-glucose 4-epimerase